MVMRPLPESSRSCEMSPWPGKGDLAFPSSWLCSWGGPGIWQMGKAQSQTCGGLLPASLLNFEISALAALWGLVTHVNEQQNEQAHSHCLLHLSLVVLHHGL